MTRYPVKEAYDDAMAQLEEYRQRRADNPANFGHDLFGAWDGTPETGPAPLICHSGLWVHPAGLFWRVYKHAWPLDYIYCFGKAWDSRGERTDPLLTIDIREIPKEFVGRFKLQITSANCHHRKAHCTVLGRAFAAGFDFAAHAAKQEAKCQFEVAARKERHNAAGECPCGAAPITVNGLCASCDAEIPF